jgi:hypothetical protein
VSGRQLKPAHRYRLRPRQCLRDVIHALAIIL